MNIQNWLEYAVWKLKNISENPRLDAEILLSYVLNKKRSWVIGFSLVELSSDCIQKLNCFLQRRIRSEPIAYLIGKKEFWSLSLLVSCCTLIPRPDTEILVENVLNYVKNSSNMKILDLGTGCGSIALALASERVNCSILGVDCVEESIKIAKKNAKILQLNNVCFLHSFWFSKVTGLFDVIVSNPPYISIKEIKYLGKEILFEPLIALVSSNNGLGAIRYIVKYSRKYLYSKGWLLIEHSWKQKYMVHKFFYRYNFINIITYQDYSGNDRVTAGQKC